MRGKIVVIHRLLSTMSRKPVAVVTGGNKGIGFAIVRGLAKSFPGEVYLTARSSERGLAALKSLSEEGVTVRFHPLDIDSPQSVVEFRDWLKQEHGSIDVLVNNAAIAFKGDATEPFGEQAEITLRTNYWSLKSVCDALFPLLAPGARVVNMSSSAGFLHRMPGSGPANSALKAKLANPELTREELDALMTNFVESAKAGTYQDFGWPNRTYSVSKVGASALSRIQQREFDGLQDKSDVVVNHVHPGYVDTDMTSHKGPLTIDQGAQSALYAALLPPGTSVRGHYIWEDCKSMDWVLSGNFLGVSHVTGPTPFVEKSTGNS
eukprot:snap_masked-scaffold124_size330879-processed-gene-0.9 protein:Tk01475 transcript:snap_masked-scaffold124_size330879-processed-gene-0.9-mRNA-1 annotation:"carbonyl reductase"